MDDTVSSCVFCGRIDRGEYDRELFGCVAFEPLNPVTMGHLLIVPIRHAATAAEDPLGAANAMQFAAEYVSRSGIEANIITSIGPNATQTVFHTHIHVVPRWPGDGLHLPWTGQARG